MTSALLRRPLPAIVLVATMVLGVCGALLAQPLPPALQVGPAANPPLPGPAAPRADGLTAVVGPAGDTLPPVVHRVQAANERLEMTVNSSRILALDQKIPQAQVQNPDILNLLPLSPTQVQIFARKPGVTDVILWGMDKRTFTTRVVVLGDASLLLDLLRTNFPKTALTVTPINSKVLISGYVDQQDAVPKIVAIAEACYGNGQVINNMTVSGVQQVMVHVKVIEISRTKLRQLGFDFAKMTNGNLVASGISGLISATATNTGNSYTGLNAQTFQINVFHNNSSFFAVLDALRQDGLGKILAEPSITAISGRPAYFTVGGEFGYNTATLSGPNVSWKQYGTRLDFVAVVLGNGRIRLEVRPSVSERDDANSVAGVPAIATREAETGVEMKAGQTLAIAGLVQQKIEGTNTGIPWISEVPYIGALFRNVQHTLNETEDLIMVTPELVDAMDASQVPPCLPGMNTTEPNDCELFLKGHLEVPRCCPGGPAGTCVASAQATNPALPAGTPATAGMQPGAYNTNNPPKPNDAAVGPPANPGNVEPSFVGPTGYDVVE